MSHHDEPEGQKQAESFPFDTEAQAYDDAFSRGVIGTRLRRAVWRRLDERFGAGDYILDLGCGTGEDALHLAARGIHVMAVDRSPEMIAVAREKVRGAGFESTVVTRQLAVERSRALAAAGPFDGVLSNFGALNCVGDLGALAAPLADCLRPGARAMLCVMGPWVPWEWGWFLARGQPRTAFRRLRRGGVGWRGLIIRYPSIRFLRRALEPRFRFTGVAAIGALLPPSYAEAWARRHPRLLARLDRWERRCETWPPLPWLADHYLAEFERS